MFHVGKNKNMLFKTTDQWFYAVRERNLEAIKANVDRFVGSRGPNGETGLMLAAKLNIPEVVFFLAPREKGCYNHDGDTALKIAIDERNFACIDELLHYEIHLKTSKGSTPLHFAVRRNLLGYLSTLVDYWKNTPDSQGINALDLAAQLGHDEAVEYLIKHGSFSRQEVEHASDIAKKACHHMLSKSMLSMMAQPYDQQINELRRPMVSHHQSSRSMGRSITDNSINQTMSQSYISNLSRSSNHSPSKKVNIQESTNTPEIYNFNCPRCRTMFESMAKRLKDMTAECHRLREELSRARDNKEESSPTTPITNTPVENTLDPNPINHGVSAVEAAPPTKLPQMPFLSFDADTQVHGEPSGTSFSIAIGNDNPQSSMLMPPGTTYGYDRRNISGKAESTNQGLRNLRTRESPLRNVELSAPTHTPEYYNNTANSSSYMQRIAALRSQPPIQSSERAGSHNLNCEVPPLEQGNSAYNISTLRPSSYADTSH